VLARLNGELKKALEAYWNGAIPESELRAVGERLRAEHWVLQKAAGSDYVPVGDFSYYDHVLDAASLLGAIPPFLRKTSDNPEGVDGQVFEDIKAAIVRDRYAYFKDFLDNFYNVDVLRPSRISEQAWQASFNVAAAASPYASYACVDTWLTDFRGDLPKIDVPTLVVHGTEDRILPYSATAERLPGLIKDLKLVTVEGGPHNIGWTHPDEVNNALLNFLGPSMSREEMADHMMAPSGTRA